MTESPLRIVRLLLAVLLAGATPAMRAVDVALFHWSGAPVSATAQLDDGTMPAPHGDGCALALVSPPVVPGAPPAHVAGPPPEAPASLMPAASVGDPHRAVRPPPSRAPPALT